MDITIEFGMFVLVFVPNFILNKELWIFGPNLRKKGYLWSKTEKVNIIVEFCIFDLVLLLHFIFKLTILIFLNQICRKIIFLV